MARRTIHRTYDDWKLASPDDEWEQNNPDEGPDPDDKREEQLEDRQLSPSNLPIGHNGRPATREELEFLVMNIEAIGRTYRTLMAKYIRDVNANIRRGRVLMSEFDRCAETAEESIVLQMQDILEKM